MMENNKFPKKELLILAIGEAICALLTVLVFLAVDVSGIIEFTFSYKVITGAILGAAVIILNFLFLSFAVNRAVDEYMALRGDKEMTDEEAEAFAAKNSVIIQNAIKKSFVVRTASIAVTLVVAFIVDWFNPLATVIPIIAYQPIITWGNHIVESIKRIAERLKAQNEVVEVAEAQVESEACEEAPCEAEVEETSCVSEPKEAPCEAETEEVDVEEALTEETAPTEETTSNEENALEEEITLEDKPQEENTEGVC